MFTYLISDPWGLLLFSLAVSAAFFAITGFVKSEMEYLKREKLVKVQHEDFFEQTTRYRNEL